MSSRVLVVEDNDSNARLFRLICEGAGYEVLEASNGLRALELVRQDPPDLVLMDLQLPGLDGLSVARVLQAHPETVDLPVVIATAWPSPESTEALRAAGARAILIKPFSRQELLSCLSGILGA